MDAAPDAAAHRSTKGGLPPSGSDALESRQANAGSGPVDAGGDQGVEGTAADSSGAEIEYAGDYLQRQLAESLSAAREAFEVPTTDA